MFTKKRKVFFGTHHIMFSFVLPFKTAFITQAHSKRLLKTEHRWEEVAESQEVRTHHHNLAMAMLDNMFPPQSLRGGGRYMHV